MNANTNTNYLTNSLTAARQFAGNVADALRESIYQTKYGYNVKDGSVLGQVKNVVSQPAKVVSSAVGDLLTNQTQRQIWKYTNVPRMAGEIGTNIARSVGVDPITGAAMAAAAPIALMSLSNVRGPISQGLRPAGYKAVAPKSKEEDPTGREPQSIPLEFALRSAMGLRSQLLPYQEFKKERPDVAPSTFSQYRRYVQSKPQPGQLVSIDPEGQSFTTIGGIVKGSAKGLNDPEIRIRGMPVTLSGALGTAAGLATAAGLYQALPEQMKTARLMKGVDYSPETKQERTRLENQLEPVERRLLQTQQIVERVSKQMKKSGVKELSQYGPDPDDQATKRVYQEALRTRGQIRNLDDKIPQYEYALKRATGVIPPTKDDPGVEQMMQQPAPNWEKGSPRTKTERHAAQAHLRQNVYDLDPSISFSTEEGNIKYLTEKLKGLKQEREAAINAVKTRLEALGLPENAMLLQERLSRAKAKVSKLGSTAADLSKELRTTYRPTTIKAPSTATIAGLAVAGTAAAVGTALVTRKLMQKSAERRLKKENPVEYLKHNHGSLEQASAALGQPNARNWQQLVPYVQ
jgi:hypothetical protein